MTVFFCPGGRYENAMESTDSVTSAKRELITRVDELMESEAPVVYPKGAKYTSSWSESMSPANIRNRPPIRAQLGVLGSSLQAERGPS